MRQTASTSAACWRHDWMCQGCCGMPGPAVGLLSRGTLTHAPYPTYCLQTLENFCLRGVPDCGCRDSVRSERKQRSWRGCGAAGGRALRQVHGRLSCHGAPDLRLPASTWSPQAVTLRHSSFIPEKVQRYLFIRGMMAGHCLSEGAIELCGPECHSSADCGCRYSLGLLREPYLLECCMSSARVPSCLLCHHEQALAGRPEDELCLCHRHTS